MPLGQRRRRAALALGALAGTVVAACGATGTSPTRAYVAPVSRTLRASDFQAIRGDTARCAGPTQYIAVRNPTARDVYVLARTTDSIVSPNPSGPYMLGPFQGARLAYPSALRLTGIGAWSPAGSNGPVGHDAELRVDVAPTRRCTES